MKINVCSVDYGEIRQFDHENFEKTIRKVKSLVKKMSIFGNNFLYEINFEESCENIKTFEDFDSFKNTLKALN